MKRSIVLQYLMAHILTSLRHAQIMWAYAHNTTHAHKHQIVHYRDLPQDLAELLTVHVIDKLPLCLSSDPNVHLDANIDYYGIILPPSTLDAPVRMRRKRSR
jgi:hypothetical protein